MSRSRKTCPREEMKAAMKAMPVDTFNVRVRTIKDGISSVHSDSLAVEEPLQFCLNGTSLSITMRDGLRRIFGRNRR
jgi:formate dehydrogenase assembly factor FdhD